MATMMMNTWHMAPISTPTLHWAEHRGNNYHWCPHCNIDLLTGEHPGFCCGRGGQYLNDTPPLPPLPEEYSTFIHHPLISSSSHILNLIFSFASLETTHEFPHLPGPPGFLAIQGCVYHHVQPTHTGSAMRWLLYDGFLWHRAPHPQWANTLPAEWIDAVTRALLTHKISSSPALVTYFVIWTGSFPWTFKNHQISLNDSYLRTLLNKAIASHYILAPFSLSIIGTENRSQRNVLRVQFLAWMSFSTCSRSFAQSGSKVRLSSSSAVSKLRWCMLES